MNRHAFNSSWSKPDHSWRWALEVGQRWEERENRLIYKITNMQWSNFGGHFEVTQWQLESIDPTRPDVQYLTEEDIRKDFTRYE